MAIAKDTTTSAGRARGMDYHTPGGRVLFEDDFEAGFCGWRDHFGGHTPFNALSLTNYPVVAGTRALKLSTGARAYVSGQKDNTISAYKNLSIYRDIAAPGASGLVSLSGYFAVGGGVGARAFYGWGISFDIQKWDNSSRAQPRLECSDPGSGTADVHWVIYNDAGGTVTIPNTTGITAGENENKFNFNYLRLTFDLAANGGLGGYHSCQINHKVIDLSGLGAGRGSTPPQGTTAGDYIGNFQGGFNAGITLYRSSYNVNNFPAWLVADRMTCTVEDPA